MDTASVGGETFETQEPRRQGLLRVAIAAGPAVILLVFTMATTFQLLILTDVPQSPANDLAKHIAAILNFKTAFLEGQWLPRIQSNPPGLPDFPLFQYYSTLLGYLSLPFLAVGLKPIVAASLGITVIRWISACALYATGRSCMASRAASLAGAVSYLLTPYIISNFYGRVALPEATAHGVLPILFYGLVRMYRTPGLVPALIVVFGVVGLAIAHPIFLLYGTAAAGVFVICAFRPIQAIGTLLILAGATLIASFQWLPAFIGRGDIAADFVYGSPYYARRFTSALGFFTFPRSLVEEGIWSDGDKLFLTPGILTIPVIALLALKGLRRLPISILLLLCGSLLLSFPPFDVWKALPQFTWGLQFPYRLLAFVALFVGIGLPLAVPRMGWSVFSVIAIVLVAQNFRLLSEPPLSQPLAVDQGMVEEVFANLDYVSVSQLPMFATEGTLINFARAVPRAFMVDASDTLLPGNYFSAPRFHGKLPLTEKYVRIQGNNKSSKSVSLWLSLEVEREMPIDGIRIVPPGHFSATYAIPDALNVFSANANYEGNAEPAYSSIVIESLDVIPGNLIQVAEGKAQTLHLSGTTVPAASQVSLWVATPADPLNPISGPILIGPGQFDTSLELPSTPGSYVLNTNGRSPGDSADARATINVSDYVIAETGHPPSKLVPARAVEPIRKHPYSRVFQVSPAAISALGQEAGDVRIELPLAYNSLFRLTQEGKMLKGAPNFRGLTQVESNDPTRPISAKFRLPLMVWPISAAGIGLILFGLLILRRLPFARS